jgi:nucleoside-diphosphate-sugar epimerase
MERNKPGIYNISSGQEISIKNLARIIIKLTGSKSKIIFTNKKTDRHFRFVLDIKKARKILGYSPLSIEEGLSRYILEVKSEIKN